jgi:hypothetical protein
MYLALEYECIPQMYCSIGQSLLALQESCILSDDSHIKFDISASGDVVPETDTRRSDSTSTVATSNEFILDECSLYRNRILVLFTLSAHFRVEQTCTAIETWKACLRSLTQPE